MHRRIRRQRRNYRGRFKKRKFYRKKKRAPASKKISNWSRRVYNKIKRTPLLKLNSLFATPNTKIVTFNRTSRLEIPRTSFINGVFRDDFVLSQFVPPEDLISYNADYNQFIIENATICFWIANTTGLATVSPHNQQAGVTYYTVPLANTSNHPQLYQLTCFSPTQQTQLHSINYTSPAYFERWSSVPYVKRLTQTNRAIRTWRLPSTMIGANFLPISMFAAANTIESTLGTLMPEDHPHGYVLLMRDAAEYADAMKITINFKIVSRFKFRIKKPDAP